MNKYNLKQIKIKFHILIIFTFQFNLTSIEGISEAHTNTCTSTIRCELILEKLKKYI